MDNEESHRQLRQAGGDARFHPSPTVAGPDILRTDLPSETPKNNSLEGVSGLLIKTCPLTLTVFLIGFRIHTEAALPSCREVVPRVLTAALDLVVEAEAGEHWTPSEPWHMSI